MTATATSWGLLIQANAAHPGPHKCRPLGEGQSHACIQAPGCHLLL